MVRGMPTSELVRIPVLSPAEADDVSDELESASAQDVLAWAAERFPGRLVLTCSWQRQSSVLMHMVATAGLDVRLVEIDTGLLFPETADTRDRLVERYGVTVETMRPLRTVEGQAAKFGANLWERHPDRCCDMRKVEPLERTLVDADAWITGIRRQQSSARRGARKVELDAARGVVKVQPLVDWTGEMVRDFALEHDIPTHPLHERGFPSIGCWPCTRSVRPGEDERAGRWAGHGKTECGLHVR
jgi:phosphoadenosine phosphosulfate reductase